MTVNQIKNRFRRARFIKNAMITLVFEYNFKIIEVLVVLKVEGKNAKRSNFTTKQSYLDYLSE